MIELLRARYIPKESDWEYWNRKVEEKPKEEVFWKSSLPPNGGGSLTLEMMQEELKRYYPKREGNT